jgi:hypothetical protein
LKLSGGLCVWIIAAKIGGIIGSTFGSYRFDPRASKDALDRSRGGREIDFYGKEIIYEQSV